MKKFNFLFPVMLLSASFSHAVTLHGTPGPDTVYANGGSIGSHTPGDDQIYGYAGDDTLYAGDGNDYVDGGAGDDTIGGGNGDDYLIGGPGNDTIWGGGGSDVIISSFGASGVAAVTNNVLIGGEGDDVIHCDERCNGFAIGGRGNDTFYISDNSNLSVNGGEGDDVYIIKSNKNMISTMSSGSQSLKIVDVSGRNKVVFEDSASYEVMFKKTGDKISITSGSGFVVLSVPVDAMTSYQFSDQTMDHGTVKMMAVE